MESSRGGLRSVDSEHRGRVIEPRKVMVAGALVVNKSGGNTEAPRGSETSDQGRNEAPAAARAAGESRRKQQLPVRLVVLRARRGGPAGVGEGGTGARGFPRNLGDLVISREASDGVRGIAEQRDDRCGARWVTRSRSSE